MCTQIQNFFKKFLYLIIVVLYIAISIVHIVYFSFIKVSDFNPFDYFNSSPLFDFLIDSNCPDKSQIIFHRYGGRKDYYWTWKEEDLLPSKETKIVDETDIKKINGNYFCYKYISYLDLLNNGQIIKKDAECPSEYSKNCGRLDTLEQELCIKNTEKCPLYDIGLGEQTDSDNYIYDKNANIYYNNDNYNKTDKKIIGKLILNDGQPCYNVTEKLWQRFNSEEGFYSHLQCTYGVFGKYSDDRYEARGDISYLRLYQDNLNQECQKVVLSSLSGYEKVHLYKREFFGIDKECNDKYILNENTYNSMHNSEKSEYTLNLVEGIMGIAFSVGFVTPGIMLIRDKIEIEEMNIKNFPGLLICVFYSILIVFLTVCTICHAVFYSRIVNNNLTGYNCSDLITNEIFRKEIEAGAKNPYYVKINFYLDLIFLLINIFIILIVIILKIIYYCSENNYKIEKKDENSEEKTTDIPLSNYYPNPS